MKIICRYGIPYGISQFKPHIQIMKSNILQSSQGRIVGFTVRITFHVLVRIKILLDLFILNRGFGPFIDVHLIHIFNRKSQFRIFTCLLVAESTSFMFVWGAKLFFLFEIPPPNQYRSANYHCYHKLLVCNF